MQIAQRFYLVNMILYAADVHEGEKPTTCDKVTTLKRPGLIQGFHIFALQSRKSVRVNKGTCQSSTLNWMIDGR